MKHKKRALFVSIILTVLVLTSGCNRRWGGDERTVWLLDHLDHYLEDLDLTETQSMAYQDIRVRLEEDLEMMLQNHEKTKDKLISSVDKPTTEFVDLADIIKQSSGKIPVYVTLLMDYLTEIYDILDEDQQQIFMADLKKIVERSHWR